MLDIGCGAGALLETLVMPASTVSEPPIKARAHQAQQETQLPSPADSDDPDGGDVDELFIEVSRRGILNSVLSISAYFSLPTYLHTAWLTSALGRNRPITRCHPLGFGSAYTSQPFVDFSAGSPAMGAAAD